MDVVSNLQFPGRPLQDTPNPFTASAACFAAIAWDLEWTKDYSRPDSNDPFCYSGVSVRLPTSTDLNAVEAFATVGYYSVYAEGPDEQHALADRFLADVAASLASADLVCGHQFSSDLAVAAKRCRSADTAASLRQAWQARASPGPAQHVGPGLAESAARIVDTRYDVGPPLVTTTSRRLVDVCNDIGIEVTQPETARESMTALQRRVEDHDTDTRQQLRVLNLRHSLSTLIVALKTTGHVASDAAVNTNYLIHRDLWDKIGYVDTDTFAELCDASC
jgi:hypothetical protein